MELPTRKELCDALAQLRKTRDEVILEISKMETLVESGYRDDETPLVSVGQGDNAQHTHDGETWKRGSGFTATVVDVAGFPTTIITQDRGGEYNGWTNRSTWNVALWWGNDEGLYGLTCDRQREWDADDAQALVEEIWPDGTTPDGDCLDDVNWEEIADAWNEE